MSKTAFVFPGQGSQHPGMGRDLFDTQPAARQAFEELDAALDAPISRLCFEGTAEELALTANTQPAVLAHSVAAWRCLAERVAPPDVVAGHSLGEYSALVAAGVLAAGDAVRTVRARGRYMQEAVPVGAGAMAALLGGSREEVEALCEAVVESDEVLAPANDNSAGQVVIAGHAAAVHRAVEAAPERGFRRAVPLPVSAPFHCALMQPAADRLSQDLAGLRFHSFSRPVVSNVTARETEDAEEERRLLEEQVTAPVRWRESMDRLVEMGVTTFVEVGPGKVLAGLLKRAARGARVLSVGTAEELERATVELA